MTKIKLVHTDSLSCETIFRIAPNGDYLIFSQCGGLQEPAIENRTLIFRSTDKGATWQKPVDLCSEEKNAVYCTEVFVFDDYIEAYVTIHSGRFGGYRAMIAKSFDNGHMWALSPNLFTEDFCLMRGGLILSDGRYMTVAQHYPDTARSSEKLAEKNEYIWASDCDCTLNTVVYEDRDGKLTAGGSVRIPRSFEGKTVWKWTEPTVVELEKGHLAMLLRFQGTDYLWRSDSFDFGKSWTNPQKTDLENPGNKPKLIKNGNRIILLNTFSKGSRYIDRNPLSVWVSYDGMKTWKTKIVAVDFPAYLSYPDGIVEGNIVRFAFELNRHDVYYVETEID